jgi:hypothetical protein
VTWIAATVIMLAATSLLLWLLSLGDRRDPVDPYRSPAAPPPQAHRGSQGASERLELPPGPEGHLMAAEALHRATGMYRDVCEERVR